jgi:hypothetical protein
VAEAVSEGQRTPREEALILARRRAEEKVPRHRFGLAYLGLAALLGAAVGLLVVLSVNGGKDSGPTWSAWKPSQTGVPGLDQIAKYVAREYALPSGRTLVGIISTPPVVQGSDQAVPLRAVLVTRGLRGESINDAQIYYANTTWAYQLCGFGRNCAISEGEASAERGLLLRREALELALYTFKYYSGLDSLLAYMPTPPGKGEKAVVLFFRRTDLAQQLKLPLARTLPPPRTNLRPGQMSAADLAQVRAYANPGAYTFAFEQAPDGSPVVVLQPAVAA